MYTDSYIVSVEVQFVNMLNLVPHHENVPCT